jgi:hypothetical protein
MFYLRPGTREHFLDTLAAAWPDEAARLAAVHARRTCAPRAEQQHVAAHVAALARRFTRRASAPAWIEPEPPRVAVQLGLALEDEFSDIGA